MKKSAIFIPTSDTKEYWKRNVERCKKTWLQNINKDIFDIFFIYDTDLETYLDNNKIFLRRSSNNYGLKQKIKNSIRFFQDYKTQYKYLIKCDDDSYVDTEWPCNIVQTESVDLFGFLGITDKFNDNKPYIWPHGCFYGLSNIAYNSILQESESLGDNVHFHFEDIWVGYSLQDEKYKKLKLNSDIYNGYNYQYIPNINVISNKKIIHTKNTWLFDIYQSKNYPQIFDLYHAIVQMSGKNLSTIRQLVSDTIDINCYNISFDPQIYESNTDTKFSDYLSAYQHWIEHRNKINSIYNFKKDSAYKKYIFYISEIADLNKIRNIVKNKVQNKLYNSICVIPPQEIKHIPFDLNVILEDNAEYRPILEDLVQKTCCELEIANLELP